MSKLDIPENKIDEFCKKNHIKKLSLFGSALKGTMTKNSDIDFLVEFYPDKMPTFLDIVRMEMDLSSILGGRKIDIRTYNDLSRYFRDEVRKNAVVKYAGS